MLLYKRLVGSHLKYANSVLNTHYIDQKAVLSQGNRACDAAAVLFGLKFADNIRYSLQ